MSSNNGRYRTLAYYQRSYPKAVLADDIFSKGRHNFVNSLNVPLRDDENGPDSGEIYAL